MLEVKNHIGTLYVSIFIPGCQSLKEKRTILLGLKNQIRSKFNVSVGELDGQDKWQTATFGVSMIGSDQRYINGNLQHVLTFIEQFRPIEICDHEIEFC